MKLSRVASGQTEGSRNIGVAVLLICLLLPCLLISILKSNLHAFSFGNFELSIRTNVQLERVQDDIAGTQVRIMTVASKDEWVTDKPANPFNSSTEESTFLTREEAKDTVLEIRSEKDNITSSAIQVQPIPPVSEEEQIKNTTNKATKDTEKMSSPVLEKETQLGRNKTTITGDKERVLSSDFDDIKLGINDSKTGNLDLKINMWCDFSHDRYDTCFIHGNVRVLGHTSTLITASPSQSNDTTLKIRPYARKWEPPVMETIKELTLKSSSKPEEVPLCTVNHHVPAVIFSTGGFMGNFFHDFTDVLVPLFIASRQYQGNVQFLITNYNAQWVNKYRAILNQLTRYEIINLDAQGQQQVHCFPQAQVGLISHKVMGVDPTNTPNNYTMDNFRDMLRTSFSLKRKSIRRGTRRPRLMILQRKRSRAIVNKREVVGLGRSMGFKVVVAGPEEMKNLSRFARSVNSADVMIGVHGAGLANMVFLPSGASLIQIVPWGGLKWACWHDFGEPAPEMKVKYLEYEIKEEESTLIEQYPRNHPVFTDPQSIQNQGWNVLWSVFLDKQNVKLDVRRFKSTLLEALQSLQ